MTTRNRTDHRALKRFEIKGLGGYAHLAAYQAYCLGQEAAAHERRRNPYPPGRRHDEWERGRREKEGR